MKSGCHGTSIFGRWFALWSLSWTRSSGHNKEVAAFNSDHYREVPRVSVLMVLVGGGGGGGGGGRGKGGTL